MRGFGVRPYRSDRPVVCVGNAVVGGAGKTPVVMCLARCLVSRGVQVHLLSRGYGGILKGPVLVDPSGHDFREVGDEPLLLSDIAPTWIARDRAAGARAAVAAGAEVIVMDDGLQNPGLIRDFSILVVDGGYGLGNGRLVPAGPLRELPEAALRKVEAVVIVGEDRCGLGPALGRDRPVYQTWLVPGPGSRDVSGCRVLAFAGIGRPEKFIDTLLGMGCDVVAARSFGDHHVYRETEVMRMLEEARVAEAVVVTTEKDYIRLPEAVRSQVRTISVELDWDDGAARELLLDRVLQIAAD